MKKVQSNIRKKILDIAISSREGHIASSFSIVEILLAIYKFFQINDRVDIFFEKTIVSKGHAVFALYGLMNEYQFLSDEDLQQVCQCGSHLIGHVPFSVNDRFNFGTGSLGHGLPYALGKAYGASLLKDLMPVFVVVGDGELNEGSCWETLLLMKKFPNSRLILLIDNNQSSTRAIPMKEVFSYISAGWNAIETDGHDIDSLVDIFTHADEKNLIVICQTKKGYPLKGMMDSPIWHHKTPTDLEVCDFKKELDLFFGADV